MPTPFLSVTQRQDHQFRLAIASQPYVIVTEKSKPLWPALLAQRFFIHLPVTGKFHFAPFHTLAIWRGGGVTRLPDSPLVPPPTSSPPTLSSPWSQPALPLLREHCFSTDRAGLFHPPFPQGEGWLSLSPAPCRLSRPGRGIAPCCETTASFGRPSICRLSSFLTSSPCSSSCLTHQPEGSFSNT